MASEVIGSPVSRIDVRRRGQPSLLFSAAFGLLGRSLVQLSSTEPAGNASLRNSGLPISFRKNGQLNFGMLDHRAELIGITSSQAQLAFP
jgi:hypothetical protein